VQRHEGVRRLAFFPPPVAQESGQLAVSARIAIDLDLGKQRLAGAPVLFSLKFRYPTSKLPLHDKNLA